jgi:hypothetical protein
MKEEAVADLLRPCIERGWSVVLHPDAIGDHGCWRDFGRLLCLENMDKRKEAGRTAAELRRHFRELPEASMCFDLAHVRQVDSTLGIARQIIREYGEKIVQLHLSELDVKSHHEPLSMGAVWAIREIAHLLPHCPVILESMVQPGAIDAIIQVSSRLVFALKITALIVVTNLIGLAIFRRSRAIASAAGAQRLRRRTRFERVAANRVARAATA